MGLNHPTVMFDHSTESLKWGEKIEHELGDWEDYGGPKNDETFYCQIHWPRLYLGSVATKAVNESTM